MLHRLCGDFVDVSVFKLLLIFGLLNDVLRTNGFANGFANQRFLRTSPPFCLRTLPKLCSLIFSWFFFCGYIISCVYDSVWRSYDSHVGSHDLHSHGTPPSMMGAAPDLEPYCKGGMWWPQGGSIAFPTGLTYIHIYRPIINLGYVDSARMRQNNFSRCTRNCVAFIITTKKQN